MASDKSLAAEIEAVVCSLTCVEQYLIEADFDAAAAAVREASRLLEAQSAEVAALQSRAFEDGARWMRDRVQNRISDRAYLMEHGNEQQAVLRVAHDVEALPLQPEGKRNA